MQAEALMLQPACGNHTTTATLQRNTNTHRTRYVEVQIQYLGDIITKCYTQKTLNHHKTPRKPILAKHTLYNGHTHQDQLRPNK